MFDYYEENQSNESKEVFLILPVNNFGYGYPSANSGFVILNEDNTEDRYSTTSYWSLCLT